MDLEIDKHDLLRVVIPGFIFIFVLLTYSLFANIFSLNESHNIFSYFGVPGIAITLPIGYLIQHIYKAIHILIELKKWEAHEAQLVIDKLANKNLKESLIEANNNKYLSWVIEIILQAAENESIKVRGYTLITRIHSAGSAMFAIVAGILFSTFYFTNIKPILLVFIFIPSAIWVVVILCLNITRENTIKAHQTMTAIFIPNNIKSIEAEAKKCFEIKS